MSLVFRVVCPFVWVVPCALACTGRGECVRVCVCVFGPWPGPGWVTVFIEIGHENNLLFTFPSSLGACVLRRSCDGIPSGGTPELPAWPSPNSASHAVERLPADNKEAAADQKIICKCPTRFQTAGSRKLQNRVGLCTTSTQPLARARGSVLKRKAGNSRSTGNSQSTGNRGSKSRRPLLRLESARKCATATLQRRMDTRASVRASVRGKSPPSTLNPRSPSSTPLGSGCCPPAGTSTLDRSRDLGFRMLN